MKADFTLVPIGGLGNRIYAICSAIVYCRQQNKSLEIIWFRDHGCNCSVTKLFSITPEIENVTLRDAKFSDLLLRDNPRRRNLWIPKFFQQFMYDRRVYSEETYKVHAELPHATFGELNAYKHIFMVSFFTYWRSEDMWSVIRVCPEINDKIDRIVREWKGKDVYGVHIRRTDNLEAIKYSPTYLYIKKMKVYLNENPNLSFFLATDSEDVKKELTNLFGEKIITWDGKYARDTSEGIVNAFIELNLLGRTKRILASSNSSFSNIAHLLYNTDVEVIKKES